MQSAAGIPSAMRSRNDQPKVPAFPEAARQRSPYASAFCVRFCRLADRLPGKVAAQQRRGRSGPRAAARDEERDERLQSQPPDIRNSLEWFTRLRSITSTLQLRDDANGCRSNQPDLASAPKRFISKNASVNSGLPWTPAAALPPRNDGSGIAAGSNRLA